MRKLAILAVVLCGVAVALFFLLRNPTPLNNPPAAAVPATPQPVTATKPAPQPPVATQNSPNPVSAAVPATATAPAKTARREYPLQFTNIPPDRVMDNMRIVFHEYASMFGGNPVGTNPEITAQLSGKNPKQANFINPEAGMRIDSQGELIDPWGTPFFFHQLSGTVMEIHSAGPDRIMWSDDDLVIK